eukprot:scaffold304335_cov13-Tisochrysis_lutea.AAC.1
MGSCSQVAATAPQTKHTLSPTTISAARWKRRRKVMQLPAIFQQITPEAALQDSKSGTCVCSLLSCFDTPAFS